MRNYFICVLFLCLMNLFGQDNYCRNNIINKDYHSIIPATKNKTETNSTLYIPVVFHVVYNAAIENVHDTLLIKQLNQLNKDFKRLNSDTVNTPVPFKSLAAGMDIQFCFASTTPSATPTNGIDRVFTAKTFFNAPPNYVILDSLKHSNLGGADAWNTAKYLNIWIGNVTNLSGYAAPPGNMMVSEDGVGVNYKTLGTINSTLPYNKFRTITHETGHFFGLKHIWGDDGGTCAGTDFMADTPNQANFTPGSMTNTCNIFPLFDACTPAGNGIMFMNFMDYTNDDCRNMFTVAQVAYMGAVINALRTGFLTTTAADCYVATGMDLQEEKKSRFSIFPNPANEIINIKTDILIKEIKIRDVIGKEIVSAAFSQQLNIKNLAPGIYFIYADNFTPVKFIKW